MTIPDMNPLGYTGLKQRSPANAVHYRRDPTVNDHEKYDVGDLWVNTIALTSWQLASKAKNLAPPHNVIATWIPIGGGTTQVRTLTPDSLVAVIPALGNINVIGTAAQGVSTTNAANTVRVTVQDASTIVKGVSQYDATQFNVAAGVVTLTGINNANPAFFAYLSAPTAAVTGEGSTYTILFDTAPVNRGACYVPGTGIFTAPSTGIYSFTTNILLNSFTATDTDYIILLQGSYNGFRVAEGSSVGMKTATNEIAASGSVIIPMTIGDTMVVNVLVFGSMAKDVKVFGGALPSGFSSFSGCLLC